MRRSGWDGFDSVGLGSNLTKEFRNVWTASSHFLLQGESTLGLALGITAIVRLKAGLAGRVRNSGWVSAEGPTTDRASLAQGV